MIRSMRSLDGSSPMVDVPIGTSEERLFGSVDIEHAMSEGTVRIDDGLFKQADGGFLCIDGIDLMDARTSLEILESSIDRVAIVERDGISASYASDARIVATTGASVRSMDRHITDRFDICVSMTRPEPEARMESIRRILTEDDCVPSISCDADLRLSEMIREARGLLPEVRLLKRHRDAISRICIRYRVPGYRGPVSCAETAVALAALNGRRKTSDLDVETASMLCLNHRRTVFETEKKTPPPQTMMWSGFDIVRFVHDDRKQNVNSSLVEKINTPSEAPVSADGSEDAVGIEPKELEAKVGRRFEVIDIMESADSKGREDDSRSKRFVECPSGRYSGSRIPKDGCRDIAIDATVRAAAVRSAFGSCSDGRIKVESCDLREKVRTRRTEQTFYFMVDSSGSLVIRNRISKVKAAIMSMLRIHYEKRDRVGLMTFNEEAIAEIMAPTRAVDEVSKAVESIKIGCGTPLSRALMTCQSLVKGYTGRHPEGFVHVVLFTDGKATKSIEPDADPCEEALKAAAMLKSSGADWIVVDTGLGTTKNDMPERLADALDGRLFMLDDLESAHIVEDLWNAGADIAGTNCLPLWERDRARGYRRRGPSQTLHFASE